MLLSLQKFSKTKQFRGTKVLFNYALKNSDKLFMFSYLCSLKKLYCTISVKQTYLFTTTCFELKKN